MIVRLFTRLTAIGLILVTPSGLVAAALTTAANIPQVIKAWRTGQTQDLCATDDADARHRPERTWVVYGVMKSDPVIVIANAVALLLADHAVSLKTPIRLARLRGGLRYHWRQRPIAVENCAVSCARNL